MSRSIARLVGRADETAPGRPTEVRSSELGLNREGGSVLALVSVAPGAAARRVCSRSGCSARSRELGGVPGDGAGVAAAHVARVRQLHRDAAVDPCSARRLLYACCSPTRRSGSVSSSGPTCRPVSHGVDVVQPTLHVPTAVRPSKGAIACSEQACASSALVGFAASLCRRARCLWRWPEHPCPRRVRTPSST